VDTQQVAAFATGISFSLVTQKRVHTLIFNLDQIGDHAHPVFGPVPDVQLLQPFTGRFLTFITEMG